MEETKKEIDVSLETPLLEKVEYIDDDDECEWAIIYPEFTTKQFKKGDDK